MIRVLPIGDRDLVRSILLRSITGPYPLAAVIDEKLGSGYRGEPSFLVALDADVPVGAAVVCGEYLRMLGVVPEARRRGAGSALLQEAERRTSTAFERVVVGAEPGNYFTPGVMPGVASFFEDRGYVPTAESMNLDAPALEVEITTVRRASLADRERVLEFIGSTFGKIWRFETSSVFDRESPTLVIAESGGAIIGFSAWCANNAALGSYGPAGVHPSRRGAGIGRDLLLASLTEMRRDGWQRALIQWAAAIDYYARVAGARVAERFVVLEKRFGA